jgi:hypothetical protein
VQVKEKLMLAEHKKKIISGIAVAFLAAFAVFYEGVVQVVTDTFIAPIETPVTPQITDAVTSQ